MRNLFVCERPYPLYKTLLRCVNSEDENDIIISNHILGMEKIYEEIKKSKFFNNVYFFDDVLYNEFNKDVKFTNLKLIKNLVKNIGFLIIKFIKYQNLVIKSENIVFNENIDFDKYDNIYVNDASSSINFYLFSKKIKVIWVEHATNTFQTYSPFYYVLLFRTLKFLEDLKLTYALMGLSKHVKHVEVNENKDITKLLKNKSIKEVSIDNLIESMNVEDKDKIFQIYNKSYNLNLSENKKYMILLTTPIWIDGHLNSKEEQYLFYNNIINNYLEKGAFLLIKPHPRDTFDYKTFFPNATIIDQSISAEILAFSKDLKIDVAVTSFSTTIFSFEKISKKAIRLIKLPHTIEGKQIIQNILNNKF